MTAGNMEATVDIGDIMATYQPGHTHADTLSFELRIDGKPIVVDTGISTYNKNDRRQYERSTIAHNCVSPGKRDSSEVWGGFRVGRRCHTLMNTDETDIIAASHDGFGKLCMRKFEMSENQFVVEDWFDGEAVCYIHLAGGVNPDIVQIEGATNVERKACEYSTEYNRFHVGIVLEILFKGYLKTRITRN
jgi:hypothetical protein